MSEVRTFAIESLAQRDRLIQFLSTRNPEFQIDFGPIRQQRTLPQNARLWKLHELTGKHLGYTPDEMHEEALCKHFGYSEKKMPGGWIKRTPLKRSSTREKLEFSKFMEATEIWYASEFGVWLGKDEA